MIEEELHKYLLNTYPKENQSVEYKEFKNLKHSVSGKVGEGDSIISYISGMSNTEGFEFQRIGDNLVDLSEERKNYILKEDLIKIDWSGLKCKGASIDDLDEEALKYIKQKLYQVKGDEKFLNKDNISLLNFLGLLNNNIPNNTCILFLGKKEISDKFIFERNKFSWKYEDKKNNIIERLSLEVQSGPLILVLEKIKSSINRYNSTLQDIDLFRSEIKQYDDDVIEEILVNSLVHRDWHIAMCNFFQLLGLMEKERGGLKLSYEKQLKRGLKIYIEKLEKRVDIRLSGKIENKDFAKLILGRTDIFLEELLILDKIVSGDTDINNYNLSKLNILKEKGLIEIRGTRYKKIYLSKNISKKIGKTGDYIKKKGLKKEQMNMLILNHLNEFGKIKLNDVKSIFPEISLDRQKNLLRNLKNKKEIDLIKKGNSKDWYYVKK